MSSAPASSANPPVKAETPEEEGWFSKWWGNTKHELSEAADHPWEATKGAVKGIANIPSDIGELLIKGSTLQTAGEMEQAAAMQSVFGQTQSAEALMQGAQEVKASAGSIELPKFKMSNAAQAGGDKIATAVSLAAGGAGIVKGGIRGVAALGKGAAVEGAELGKTTAAAGKALPTEGAVAEGAKTADVATDVGKTTGGAAEGAGTGNAAGDGAKVLKRPESLREKYLGRTPGKNSRTGKEVQARMRKEGTLRDGPDGPEFKASDGEWYPLKDADMAHKTDAVTWWNETGRGYGAKSQEVRDWMLDSKNYTLDHYSINRSLGAKIGETYLPPLK
nr:GH-E family nuclease [Burkholderia vietnamiensis]